jgi:uncharacterized repeat protein (TIGR03803 family)
MNTGFLLNFTTLLDLLCACSAGAQTYSVVHSFGALTNLTGFHPHAPLVRGPDGTLYGTASEGEARLGVYGTVFSVQSDGTRFTVLKYFTNYTEAVQPYGGLALSGSTLYGTTYGGGYGTVFKLNTDGSGFAVLKAFNHFDGANPYAGLTLFGPTTSGGSVSGGTVFKINTNGTGVMVIKDFTGSDGSMPQAGLIVSGQTLYGTTSSGGGYGYGTVFKVNIDGSEFAALKEFDGANDGAQPDARLVLSGQTLYGTTIYGGAAGLGTAFQLNTDGSAFAVLQHFTGTEGSWPGGGLVLAGARLFGTTSAGGALDAGVLFSLSLQPSLRVTRPTASTIGLAWPYPSDGFSLQQIANLGGMEWTSVTTPPAHVGDEWQVDLSSPPGHRFYRLHRP